MNLFHLIQGCTALVPAHHTLWCIFHYFTTKEVPF